MVALNLINNLKLLVQPPLQTAAAANLESGYGGAKIKRATNEVRRLLCYNKYGVHIYEYYAHSTRM